MKTQTLCLLVAASACALTTAHAQVMTAQTAGTEHGIPDAPTRLTNSATTSTGTILKRDLRWRSKIPLNKTYGQLTPEQKAELNKLYDSLPDGDEPPFPLLGIKPMFSALQKAQNVLQAKGELNLAVTVGPDGTPTQVVDYGGVTGPNAYEMTNYAAAVFMKAKYKPAVCQGKPCIMQFPFKLALN